jgi:4-aminobutyrate aminotransferase/diaminobutyrate-pyruvate transaminase/4-aminobutyrate aminotransferase/(S)-3-amino-2-methylpropionate transaminase
MEAQYMEPPQQSILDNSFLTEPEPAGRIETGHRRIVTSLPAPCTAKRLADAARVFPRVNCYQPPIVWDRADGYQVYDAAGNCWIDFSSTAVMTNTGHGHPAIRAALRDHLDDGLLAQFSFASDIRVQLAEKLISLAPPGCEKVYFWTVGSEAIEAAFRLVREWGLRSDPAKYHILTFAGDYHGWTLGAHQLSGESATKPWLPQGDPAVHHLPFPRMTAETAAYSDADWQRCFDENVQQLLARGGVTADQVAAVFIETLQGWGALPLPTPYVQRLREWADQHGALLVFDEIQTGFGRTGKWFAHEHYGVRADLICVGKGVTSSLPLAAVLGPADVLDVLPPAEIATTHAGHPLSCAAAMANLRILEEEQLIAEAARKGVIVRDELDALQRRFPDHISEVSGLGLVQAIHVSDPRSADGGRKLARDWIWAAVKQGVMLFQVNRPTLKVCPPLVIPDDALMEGIGALGDALESIILNGSGI